MSRKIVEPEECLRWLADDTLRQAEAGTLVLHCTLGVRAAVNAFVLLGLIPESYADKVLYDYQESLQSRSLGTAWGLTEGELPARSGVADIWAAHVAGSRPLAGVPTAVAPAGVSFPATVCGLKADLRLEWVKLAQGQWRISFRASADDPGGEPDRPSVVMREAMAMITVTDDTGHRYRPRVEGVTWERVAAGRQEWRGELVAGERPDGPAAAWLQIASAESGTSERVPLQAAAVAAPASTAAAPAASTTAPPWATPAEGYLAQLARVAAVKVGWTEVDAQKTAEIVATVADCLLAVGALPPGSPLLRGQRPSRQGPLHQEPLNQEGPGAATWRDALAARWARRAHRSATAVTGDATHQVLLAELPLKQASAVIESVSAADGLVGVALHGRPWVPAAPWPVIAPCFTVHAVDDNSNTYDGLLVGFQPASTSSSATSATSTEARGTFWLWPPVPGSTRSLAITVSTLWEAATAEIALADPAHHAVPDLGRPTGRTGR